MFAPKQSMYTMYDTRYIKPGQRITLYMAHAYDDEYSPILTGDVMGVETKKSTHPDIPYDKVDIMFTNVDIFSPLIFTDQALAEGKSKRFEIIGSDEKYLVFHTINHDRFTFESLL